MLLAFNIAAFYIGWVASIMAAANGWATGAALAGMAVVGLHLAVTSSRVQEMWLIGAAGVTGVLCEALLMRLGVAQYALSPALEGVPPFWLITLWMAFATTMNVSLAWLKERLVLASGLGLIVAPISYLAGERLGGMQLGEPSSLSLAAIGLVWAVAFPFLVVVARWSCRRFAPGISI